MISGGARFPSYPLRGFSFDVGWVEGLGIRFLGLVSAGKV